jgi:hypothetical protein
MTSSTDAPSMWMKGYEIGKLIFQGGKIGAKILVTLSRAGLVDLNSLIYLVLHLQPTNPARPPQSVDREKAIPNL